LGFPIKVKIGDRCYRVRQDYYAWKEDLVRSAVARREKQLAEIAARRDRGPGDRPRKTVALSTKKKGPRRARATEADGK
jgi:hypothetical protein